ncbi:non-hydrolyzing UDP-N-acetylglucosamine 2-epimerase [Spirochaetota bacterium]
MKYNKSKLKVMTILGTRPEIIRLSCVIHKLDEAVKHCIVHTGQNYDYELNEIFFKDLEIRKPDHFLAVNTKTVGNTYGEILIKSEKALIKEKPDAVFILGDTNSSIAGIIAKRMKIPLYHMEAGNRCFDANVPEEINRRIIDHTADFNLVYTEHARRHLLSEGLPHRRIFLTGSPLCEVLHTYMHKIDRSDILKQLKLKEKGFFLVSVHREENVDNSANLKSIISVLNSLAKAYSMPVIVSTHPRTKKRLACVKTSAIDKRIRFLKPFGFIDYVHLQKNAACTISDSGTICEESSMLSFPAVTIRNSMERPEALDTGTIILTGFDKDTVLDSIAYVINEHKKGAYLDIPKEYMIRNTSSRVVKLILGTAKLSNTWSNIERNDG